MTEFIKNSLGDIPIVEKELQAVAGEGTGEYERNDDCHGGDTKPKVDFLHLCRVFVFFSFCFSTN